MKNGIASNEMKKNIQSKGNASRRKANPASSTKVSSEGRLQRSGEQTPFEKLFEDLLKDILWAEQQLVQALEKMSGAATTNELKSAFEDHLFVTQKHVSRLEKVFSMLGKPADSKKCAAMEGLIKEAEHIIKETKEGTMTRDAALIISAQKVEHYEIAAYGSLVQIAYTLGHDDIAYILEKTLRDEEDTDCQLTDIAEGYVNPMADHDDEQAEGQETTEDTE